VNAPSSPVENSARKSELYDLLRQVCVELDITEAQYEQAKTAYEAISEWLADAESPRFKNVETYAHGSLGLRTITKPISGEEFDVDLICFFPTIPASTDAATVKKLVGDRLRANARYSKMLIEKKRCWRLDYAGIFHADIAPTIRNVACPNNGELVPDKLARDWKPTHPRGYKHLFEKRACLVPRTKIVKVSEPHNLRADTAPFPEHGSGRGILRRTVQLLKRHRDIRFEHVGADISPISIIITTLAARSYAFSVNQWEFETAFDVLEATITNMPRFVERRVVGGRTEFVVANETTAGENFADRWNSEPKRAEAFFAWHQQVLEDFQSLSALEGRDSIQLALARMLGARAVNPVFEKRIASISAARAANQLHVAPRVGLTTVSASGLGLVRQNTFYGR